MYFFFFSKISRYLYISIHYTFHTHYKEKLNAKSQPESELYFLFVIFINLHHKTYHPTFYKSTFPPQNPYNHIQTTTKQPLPGNCNPWRDNRSCSRRRPVHPCTPACSPGCGRRRPSEGGPRSARQPSRPSRSREACPAGRESWMGTGDKKKTLLI